MSFEVEIRALIEKTEYARLLDYLEKNGKVLADDTQETHYLNSSEDLRIQKNNNYSKIWLKKGRIHDEVREELEVKFDRSDFEKITKIFDSIGLNANIKWFRYRKSYEYNKIKINLDYTKGYGYIIELEKMCETEALKDLALKELKAAALHLGVNITPKEEFDKKLAYYKENWKKLIS
jgi:predicted adenylyl cyclase CyaB